MKVDLNKLEQMIKNHFKDLKFKADYSVDRAVSISTTLKNFRGLSSDVEMSVIAYDPGILLLYYTFNKLEKNDDNFRLVNQYNQNNHFFKCFISEEGNLEFLTTSFLLQSTQDTLDFVEMFHQLFFSVLKSNPLYELERLTFK